MDENYHWYSGRLFKNSSTNCEVGEMLLCFFLQALSQARIQNLFSGIFQRNNYSYIQKLHANWLLNWVDNIGYSNNLESFHCRVINEKGRLAMMKQQGCSWLLETGKICIDRNALLFMFMHYFWHGCLNSLTSYYSNDSVSKLEFPAIVLNLKSTPLVVYHYYRQWVAQPIRMRDS